MKGSNVKTLVWDEPDTTTIVSYDGDLTVVNINDLSTGIHARGSALRNLDDDYNENIGLNLAHSRAIQRLERKLERYWIRQTV